MRTQNTSSHLKVCAIVTEYRYNSHAEMIIGRLFGQFEYQPSIEVASIYVDQFPSNDLSRGEAEKHNIMIYSSIKEAIHAVGDELAGVLIIGEHGQYDRNEFDQIMYPRRRFIEEALLALDELKIRVPIFSDKHLSYNMEDSIWIYEALKSRNIPFLGGSSIPLVVHHTGMEAEALHTLEEILIISFGSTEDYGYHAMEIMQCLAERRYGGETGISSVHTTKGDAVWKAMDLAKWPEELMLRALDTYMVKQMEHPRTRVGDPVLFEIEYKDGLKGYVLQLQDEVEQWSYAFRNREGVIHARLCESGMERPFHHFSMLVSSIEAMIVQNHSSVPLERTFLTTTMINMGMQSLFDQKRVDASSINTAY
ncbi:MAG TPA: hypothetical protein IAA29_14010 [Candidatus Paenibacillus intestinavium]|nr:hypothetical protein [Candidatus Paenibacillus intestinavium]